MECVDFREEHIKQGERMSTLVHKNLSRTITQKEIKELKSLLGKRYGK